MNPQIFILSLKANEPEIRLTSFQFRSFALITLRDKRRGKEMDNKSERTVQIDET